MALRINSNIASVFSQKNVTRTAERLQGNFERLSSGLRINKAADDAAGMAVSEKMRAHLRSMKQAMRNTNDGISMVQTAEGGLNEIGNIMSRMRELAVEAASDVLQSTERGFLSTEFTALKSEMDRIALATEFNGLKLANGSTTNIAVQVGINNVSAEDRITVTLQSADQSAFGLDNDGIATAVSAQTAITALDAAISSLSTARAAYGAFQNRLTSAMHNLEISYENLVSSESAIRDVDFAAETADMTRNNIFQQAGVAVLAQANQTPKIALQLLQ